MFLILLSASYEEMKECERNYYSSSSEGEGEGLPDIRRSSKRRLSSSDEEEKQKGMNE